MAKLCTSRTRSAERQSSSRRGHNTVETRKQLVTRLLEEPERINEVSKTLAWFDWDSEDELAELHRKHVCQTLDRYLTGVVDAATVQGWAEFVEGRDDVGREQGQELLLNDAIHSLANPDLDGPLTKASAEHWLGRLRSA